MAGKPRSDKNRRKPPWTRLAGLGLGVLALVASVGLIDLLWPARDQSLSSEEQSGEAVPLASPPSRPITVLLIGSDADRLAAASNGAAPAGAANSDTLLLLRVDPAGPLQILAIPTELAVKVPGQTSVQPLGSLFKQGGPALTAGAVAELVGLDPGQPERYVVLPRSALRELVDGLGGLEVNLDQPLTYKDKSQAYSIDLQAGLQRLKGVQVEQLVRYRNKAEGEEGRRARQQRVVTQLASELVRPQQWAQLPERWQRLTSQLDTNLSQGEALSLITAGLRQQKPLRYSQLPLEPPAKPDQALREISSKAPTPLWPAKP
ncbi:LCP family protein [Synechococcus sp. CS-1329]|uniref:LCP family protein n=1 Tax=Synechococcus sp. CS-1329 TaxID=2847975 RepID=UPI00223AF7F0|nr:LCP family protein [Synechococcus sp. CS-1329]MCT0218507.1 LCP family protein [Synechococcus sp. CS-1329]